MFTYLNCRQGAAIAVAVALLAGGPALGETAEDATAETDITIEVLPFAQLEVVGDALLYLEVPPATSTIPSKGVAFVVTGNASAAVTAEPDAFIAIPGEGIMGRATLNGNPLGYKLEMRFPAQGVVGSPPQYAALPLFEEGSTVPPLEVDLMITSGSRSGLLHMEASHDWTPDGALPLPGVYVGGVTLTVTAD